MIQILVLRHSASREVPSLIRIFGFEGRVDPCFNEWAIYIHLSAESGTEVNTQEKCSESEQRRRLEGTFFSQ